MIGALIKNLRESQGFTMQQASDLSGISQSFISQLESGKRDPSPETLTKLANLFKVSKLYLYREAGLLNENDILSLLEEKNKLREVLKEIEAITRGLGEFNPTYEKIHKLASKGLGDK